MESYDWLWPGPYLGILRPWAQENAPPPSFVRIQLCVSKKKNTHRKLTKDKMMQNKSKNHKNGTALG
jgi:predicted FMN-binding regulatory protein PaiB